MCAASIFVLWGKMNEDETNNFQVWPSFWGLHSHSGALVETSAKSDDCLAPRHPTTVHQDKALSVPVRRCSVLTGAGVLCGDFLAGLSPQEVSVRGPSQTFNEVTIV